MALLTRYALISFIFLISFQGNVAAQIYFAAYTDKANTPYSIHYPEAFLSQKSILRRAKHDIPIEHSDLPPNPEYVRQVAEHSVILYQSKWLNGSVIRIDDSLNLEKIEALPFVDKLHPLKDYFDKKRLHKTKEEVLYPLKAFAFDSSDYGPSFHQANMLKIIELHKRGLQGDNMIIAVMDGGFNDLFKMRHFDSLLLDGRVLAQRDYVDLNHESVDGAWHGTHVMSCVAAVMPGLMIGTAPKASYILLRTEDVNSETRLEEFNWIAAAEFADSMGADILNTSLGYTDFSLADGSTDSLMSYSWENLDGNSSYITRASDLAARKGMLVINSAGNSGGGAWRYIGMPADGDSVLAIGALDSLEERIGFSSFGRSKDPRVKPNVMAMGHRVVLAHKTSLGVDTIRLGSGTSFSGPILAGAAACLWQARPQLSNMDIFELIQRHSDRYANPDTAYGYGLPDFSKALKALQEDSLHYSAAQIFPNPFNTRVIYRFHSMFEEALELELTNLKGQKVLQLNIVLNKGLNEIMLNTKGLEKGLYILSAKSRHFSDRQRILKAID